MLTVINSNIRGRTLLLELSSQNNSNKQSIQTKLCKTRTFASSAFDKNSVKRFIEAHMVFFHNWTCSFANGISTLSTWVIPGKVSWVSSVVQDRLYSWAWVQVTFNTRCIALRVFSDEMVFSADSCNTRCRLSVRTQVIPGLQEDFSKASSNTEHSGCHQQ